MGACLNIPLCKGVKYILIQYTCSYMRVYAEHVCAYIDACLYIPVSFCLSMSAFVSVCMISMYICVYLYMLSKYLHWRHACSEKLHMCIHEYFYIFKYMKHTLTFTYINSKCFSKKGHRELDITLTFVFSYTHAHVYIHAR